MSAFPAPYPTGNPYVGSAAEAGSGAAGIYNSLQNRIAAAANQQATQQRQKDLDAAAAAQRNFQNMLEMHAQGAIPADLESGPPDVAGQPPQLRSSAPNPAAQGAGQTVVDPQNPRRRYYLPTASEKEEAGLNDTNSFVPQGQLGAMLEAAGHAPGKRIKAADSHSLLQAINEAQPKDEPYDIDTSGKFQDAQGRPAAVLIGKKTGKVRMLDLSGGQSSQSPSSSGAAPGGPFDLSDDPGQPGAQPSAAQPNAGAGQPGGAFSFAPPEKADKPDVSQMIPGQQGPNGGMLIYDKNTQSIKEVPYPQGSKGVLTADQQDRSQDRKLRLAEVKDAKDAREEARQQGDRDRAQKQIDIFQTREQEEHQKIKEYGAVLSQPNTVSKESNQLPVLVVDPKTGRETPMTEERRAYFKTQYDKATAMADTWHQQAVKLVQRHGGDTGGTAKTQQNTEPPTMPGRGGPVPKTASIANIRAYAKKNGLKEADAVRKAKSEGYAITGQ